MARIERNIRANKGFAGRAGAPTMRIDSGAMAMEKSVIKSEGALVQNSLKVGTAVGAGLKAGMSGQTTEDLGKISIDGIDARDAGGFQTNKFMDEFVSTLGGSKGMMNLDNQNVAMNLVNNYQQGVKIGHAHAQLQANATITNAQVVGETTFNEDIRNENYNGAVDRAWSTHLSDMKRTLNDKNTVPAVKNKINAYLDNPMSKATFDKKYTVKLTNSIAKSNSIKATSELESAYDVSLGSDNPDIGWSIVENKMRSLSGSGAIHYSDEEIQSKQYEYYSDYANMKINNPATTVMELDELGKGVKSNDNITNEIKSSLDRNIFQARIQNQKTNYNEAKDDVSRTINRDMGFTISGTLNKLEELKATEEITPTQFNMLKKTLTPTTSSNSSEKIPITREAYSVKNEKLKALTASVSDISGTSNSVYSIEDKQYRFFLIEEELSNLKGLKNSAEYEKVTNELDIARGELVPQLNLMQKMSVDGHNKFALEFKKEFNGGDLTNTEYQNNLSALAQVKSDYHERVAILKMQKNGLLTQEDLLSTYDETYGQFNDDTFNDSLRKSQRKLDLERYQTSSSKQKPIIEKSLAVERKELKKAKQKTETKAKEKALDKNGSSGFQNIFFNIDSSYKPRISRG